jgi:hypothetical protein
VEERASNSSPPLSSLVAQKALNDCVAEVLLLIESLFSKFTQKEEAESRFPEKDVTKNTSRGGVNE